MAKKMQILALATSYTCCLRKSQSLAFWTGPQILDHDHEDCLLRACSVKCVCVCMIFVCIDMGICIYIYIYECMYTNSGGQNRQN